MIQACYGETLPPIILIGHGVGGAIAVHTASNMLLPTTVGLVAIDVVEGDWMLEKPTEGQLSACTLTEVTKVFFYFFCSRQCHGGSPQHTEFSKGKTKVLQVCRSRHRMEVCLHVIDTECTQISVNLILYQDAHQQLFTFETRVRLEGRTTKMQIYKANASTVQ